MSDAVSLCCKLSCHFFFFFFLNTASQWPRWITYRKRGWYRTNANMDGFVLFLSADRFNSTNGIFQQKIIIFGFFCFNNRLYIQPRQRSRHFFFFLNLNYWWAILRFSPDVMCCSCLWDRETKQVHSLANSSGDGEGRGEAEGAVLWHSRVSS